MTRVMRAIGFMSGTSMDGVDITLIESDGETVVRRGEGFLREYTPSERAIIEEAVAASRDLGDRTARPGPLALAEDAVTRAHIEAMTAYLTDTGLKPGDIDVAGFHGQTVLHRPEEALTVQLGDGALLARETGVDIVYDMRANDMAHGGQGAPLVPVYHAALAMGLPSALEPGFGPVAFVNIGGISNVTFVAPGVPPVAFDSGPGNALIDQWVEQNAGIPFDDGGRIASEGSADMAVVERYLSAPFFARNGPKSLDRGDFTLDGMAGLELSDGAATLSVLTAAAIARAAEKIETPPALWIVSGGGARNDAIMDALRAQAGADTRIVAAGEAGFNADMMEAEAWAYLAVRSRKGLPLTFPTTTGCREPVTGGNVADPR